MVFLYLEEAWLTNVQEPTSPGQLGGRCGRCEGADTVDPGLPACLNHRPWWGVGRARADQGGSGGLQSGGSSCTVIWWEGPGRAERQP